MSTSTSTYRSIIIRSGSAPQASASATRNATLIHILWLSGSALIDATRLGSELDSIAHPPSGRGFSAGTRSLGKSPCAVIQIFDAALSERGDAVASIGARVGNVEPLEASRIRFAKEAVGVVAQADARSDGAMVHAGG